jgi:hypothetical protein
LQSDHCVNHHLQTLQSATHGVLSCGTNNTHHTLAVAVGLVGRAFIGLALAVLAGLAIWTLNSTSAAVVVVGVGALQHKPCK